MLVTFYNRVFVTLSSDNYIGREKKKRKNTFYYGEPYIYYMTETRDMKRQGFLNNITIV